MIRVGTFGCARPGALVALALSTAGCSISTGPEFVTTRGGLGCVDDSAACVSQRQATLSSLVNDKGRGWVKEHPTPEAYASGVRLFAYKSKKTELTCDELAHGKREADGARPSLASAGGRLTPAQVSRGNMLAGEVSRELQREMNKRCKRS